MTITDIDKQFEWRNNLDYFVHGWLQEHGIEISGVAYEKLEEAVGDIVHEIYSQAKAEQRETDAKLAEKEKFKLFDGSLSPSMKVHNIACDSIASEIRGQHECKQTTQVSLQVKEQ